MSQDGDAELVIGLSAAAVGAYLMAAGATAAEAAVLVGLGTTGGIVVVAAAPVVWEFWRWITGG
eukprot:CAMPEP_0114233232 /NCGR_PEP_ID=MMETSP0058-20121206/5045_1 /TAXON_ID=36894 /ORGANISM="Pyramimonas parkeae, CCMP726" /LENGTH=63 /DNA_ID=CAMNT_0001344789 /DNA_START=3991 /DNA_END=4179 /DNA_ORIENTATION=-